MSEEGMVDTADVLDLTSPTAREVAANAERETAARRKVMTERGGLGLPSLLEKRRWEYGITDGAFRYQPFHDRILVHQVAQYDGETFTPGGSIVMPELTQSREQNTNPEGILVAAGMKALDELRANGIDLGHKVTFIRNAPFRKRVDISDGYAFYVLMFRSGDIMGSEDLANELRAGTKRVVFDDDNCQHMIEDRDGHLWKPSQVSPFMAEDY